MKMKFIILLTIFSFLTIYSNAQTRTTKVSYAPNVTKGYYSIGQNAAKLNNGTALQLVQTSTHYTAEKGYYTISEKRYKLPKFYKVDASAPRPKTPVKKGYYSIGTNADKIK